MWQAEFVSTPWSNESTSVRAANLLASCNGLDLVDALALDLFRSDALGDRVHRRAVGGTAIESVGEYGPAVLEPGAHISEHRRPGCLPISSIEGDGINDEENGNRRPLW